MGLKLLLLCCFLAVFADNPLACELCLRMLGGIIGCPAPVAASSPTVACLRSSKKVHSPSRKSLANFLPVLRMSSRPATDLSRLSGRLTSGEAVSATSLVRSEFVDALVMSFGRSFLWLVELASASALLRAVLVDRLSFLGGRACLGGGFRPVG